MDVRYSRSRWYRILPVLTSVHVSLLDRKPNPCTTASPITSNARDPALPTPGTARPQTGPNSQQGTERPRKGSSRRPKGSRTRNPTTYPAPAPSPPRPPPLPALPAIPQCLPSLPPQSTRAPRVTKSPWKNRPRGPTNLSISTRAIPSKHGPRRKVHRGAPQAKQLSQGSQASNSPARSLGAPMNLTHEDFSHLDYQPYAEDSSQERSRGAPSA